MKRYAPYLSYFVFGITLVSTLVSLYFSEILQFVPCILCWYQRIFMYPLVIISAVSILRKQTDLHYYALPFSIIGLLIAFYQNLLVWHVIPEQVAPCVNGVSCIEQPLVLFGFMTIPLGSMIAFALITISMLLYGRYFANKK